MRIISSLDSSVANPACKRARKGALDEFPGVFFYALVRRAIQQRL